MLSVNNTYYFAYSAECLNMFAQTNCLFYNLSKGSDLSLDDPYEMVRDGS